MVLYLPEYRELSPRLAEYSRDGLVQQRSQVDHSYNCVAFAIGDLQNHWWPTYGGKWDAELPNENTEANFRSFFFSRGFKLTHSYVALGKTGVALYVNEIGSVCHVAHRPATSIHWHHKLGEDIDIVAPLEALEGETYGKVGTLLSSPS